MKHIYLFILSLTLCNSTYSQISEPGTPASFTTTPTSSYRISSNVRTIASKEFPILDSSALVNLLKEAKSNCSTCRNNYYSYIKNVVIDVISEGTYFIQDGVQIWQYNVKANDAKGIQLYFNAFKIPAGGKLYIYNKDRTMTLGAYTEGNNTDGDNYALQPITGEEIIIEYNAPLNTPSAILKIDEIGYLFSSPIERFGIYSLFGSEACEYDVASSYGAGWDQEIRSVACVLTRITLASGEILGGCGSGALLNNSFQDKKPYFLTANHIISGKDADKIIFLFNYQNTIAGFDSPLSTTQTVSGCRVLGHESSATSSDYALLLLNETPPAAYNVCYAGWDYSDIAGQYSSKFVGIHHPTGDVKKISVSLNTLVSESADYTGPDPNFWRVMWTDGITEGGSSGSPLFNDQHKIIGQLNGGHSDCSTNGPDWYGKFSTSWADGYFAYFLKTTPISVSSVSTLCPVYNATCSNNVKDGFETGIDCGGSLCPPCKPTCSDGIQNGSETGVDCGGSCTTCAPTCFDYIKNQGETDTDCGGPCRACIVPNCTDHRKNQNETGIDCGGVCGPCSNFCADNILNGDEIDVDCGGSCKICEGLITLDSYTNGNFEYFNCPNYPPNWPPQNNESFAFFTNYNCTNGNWYASHGVPCIENWINETPVNHSIVLSAYKPNYNDYNNSLSSGIFYQLPSNLDPTAEYTLHHKTRYDGSPPVHVLDFYITSGLVPIPLPPYIVTTPSDYAQHNEPTYPFNKYRIAQLGWTETHSQTQPWYDYSFKFTVPTDHVYNQLWINAKNISPNITHPNSLTYLDDFVLMISRPGTQPIDCSLDMSFNTILPSYTKAQNSITISTITVAANQTATAKAGNFVRLSAGFHASSGSNFTAEIGACSDPTVRNGNYLINPGTHSNNSTEQGDNSSLIFSRDFKPSSTNNSKQINIYPNPTIGKFAIELKDGMIDKVNISTVYGTSIFQNSFADMSQIDLDISFAPAASYIVQIYSGEKIYSKKIIIVH